MTDPDTREPSTADRFQLLVEAVQDYGIFMLDPAGRVMSWNAGAERIKGYKADEIIGSMLLTWHNLHYYQVLMQGLRDAIAGGRLAGFVAAFHAQRAEGDIEPH